MNAASRPGPFVRALCIITFSSAAALLVNPTTSQAQNVYVANATSGQVIGYDAATGNPLPGFTPPVNGGDAGLLLSGNNLYVTHTGFGQAPGSIYEYDATTGALNQGFAPITNDVHDVYGLALSGNKLYVASADSSYIYVYDSTVGGNTPLQTYTGLANIAHATPFGIAISGNTLYVADWGNAAVYALDATTFAPIPGFTTITQDRVAGLALSPDGQTLYVSNFYNPGTINAYDATSGAPDPAFQLNGLSGLNTFNGPMTTPFGMAVSGNTLYEVNEQSGTVFEFNATDGTYIPSTEPSGLSGPIAIAVSSTPEPGSACLALLGSLALAMRRRRRG